MPTRRRGHVVGRHGGGVGERLVEMPGKLGQQIDDVGTDDFLMRLAAKVPGHHARMFELAETLFVEANRCRQDRVRTGRHHGRDDRRRIDAAREECAERHVAQQPQTHGLGDKGVEPLEILVFARRIAVARELQIPVLLDRDAPLVGDQEVSRRQLRDVAENRLRRGDVLQRQVRVERSRAPVTWHI